MNSYSTWDNDEPPEPVEEAARIERRAWLRLPSRLFTVCYLSKGPATDPLPCRVHDVSAAGINLVLKRPVEAGTALTVQLPGLVEGFEASVLAHVNHVRMLSNGEWSLGCTLALELDDETLTEFGVRRSEPLPIDQRSWKRFTLNVPVRYTTIADVPLQGNATLTDISAVGVGMQVDLPLRVGTALNLHIGGVESDMFLNILACVVRITSHYASNWRVGCTFVRELTEQELLRIA
jgi:hypothetical protein